MFHQNVSKYLCSYSSVAGLNAFGYLHEPKLTRNHLVCARYLRLFSSRISAAFIVSVYFRHTDKQPQYFKELFLFVDVKVIIKMIPPNVFEFFIEFFLEK